MLVEGNLQELQNWIFQPLLFKIQFELSQRTFCSNLSTQGNGEEREAVGTRGGPSQGLCVYRYSCVWTERNPVFHIRIHLRITTFSSGSLGRAPGEQARVNISTGSSIIKSSFCGWRELRRRQGEGGCFCTSSDRSLCSL